LTIKSKCGRLTHGLSNCAFAAVPRVPSTVLSVVRRYSDSGHKPIRIIVKPGHVSLEGAFSRQRGRTKNTACSSQRCCPGHFLRGRTLLWSSTGWSHASLWNHESPAFAGPARQTGLSREFTSDVILAFGIPAEEKYRVPLDPTTPTATHLIATFAYRTAKAVRGATVRVRTLPRRPGGLKLPFVCWRTMGRLDEWALLMVPGNKEGAKPPLTTIKQERSAFLVH